MSYLCAEITNMRRDSSFCAKSVRYNIFTNGAPYEFPNPTTLDVDD